MRQPATEEPTFAPEPLCRPWFPGKPGNTARPMILWRRLDVPGHDTCRILSTADGARLVGVAVFAHPAGPAALSYAVDCDDRWRPRAARIEGWVGERAVNHTLARDGVGWTLDGAPVRNLDGCVDLDLGITPATHTLALRRMDLKIGDEADAPAAWLALADDPGGAFLLRRLDQTWVREDTERYVYTSDTGYEGTLRVDSATRFVTDQPKRWVRET